MAKPLSDNAFVVFVYDKNGKAIPGAHVQLFIDNAAGPGLVTSGQPDAPARFQVPGAVKSLEIRVAYLGQTQQKKVNTADGRFTFTFDTGEADRNDSAPPIPRWFPIAGAVFAAVAIIFFMTLVFVGSPANANTRMSMIIVLSLTLAMVTFFFGAEVAASGSLPLPFVRENPIKFSAASGVAAFVVVFVLASWIYPESSSPATSSQDSSRSEAVKPKQVVYKTCQDPSFGRASWQHSQIVDQSSGWRGGGGSQANYCAELSAAFIQSNSIGSDRDVEVLGSNESDKRDVFGHVEYNYTCRVRVSWGSVWNARQDPRCGVEP